MEDNKKSEQRYVDQVVLHMERKKHKNEEKKKQWINQGRHLVAKSNEIKIKDGNEDGLRESSFSVFEREKELALLEHQVTQLTKQNDKLNMMLDRPFFGRLDIVEKQQKNKYYIGMASFSYNEKEEVIDWRTPIASLFYNQQLGKVNYCVLGKNKEVDITLKRQFIIENKSIQTMVDTEETIVDKVLLETLAKHSTSKMKHITATIQQEQNAIIRDLSHPLIMIKGVAGSGKTAVLLQRLAYLLYHKRETVKNEEILFLSPNKVFSHYISNVLPSLGEEDVYRRSFEEWLFTDLLPVHKSRDAFSQETRHFLNSERCITLFLNYIESLKLKGLQYEPLRRKDGKVVITKKQWAQWFKGCQSNQLQAQLQELQTLALAYIEQQEQGYFYSDELDDRFNIEGNDYIVKYQQELEQLPENQIVTVIKERMVKEEYEACKSKIKQWQFIRNDKQYLHFLLYLNQNQCLSQAELSQAIDQLNRGCGTAEEVQWFALIKEVIKKEGASRSFKEIFIDEVQDYTPLNIFCLTCLFPHANYTLCGDEEQLIYKQKVSISLFSNYLNHPFKQYVLQKNYRSTKEISNFANAILNINLCEEVLRHGEQPTVIKENNLMQVIDKTSHRVLIVTPTMEDAQEISEQYGFPCLMNASQLEKKCVVAPLEQAKGLEYDCVIMAKTEQYTMNDKNELYTMATRAMHQLYILETHQLDWLTEIDGKYYKRD